VPEVKGLVAVRVESDDLHRLDGAGARRTAADDIMAAWENTKS